MILKVYNLITEVNKVKHVILKVYNLITEVNEIRHLTQHKLYGTQYV